MTLGGELQVVKNAEMSGRVVIIGEAQVLSAQSISASQGGAIMCTMISSEETTVLWGESRAGSAAGDIENAVRGRETRDIIRTPVPHGFTPLIWATILLVPHHHDVLHPLCASDETYSAASHL